MYLSIPDRNKPRIIIPVNNFRCFKAGLDIHNTASTRNRFIKLVILYGYPLLKLSKYKISDLDPILVQMTSEIKNNLHKNSSVEFAFYYGTEGNLNQKLTILLMNAEGHKIGILKYPLRPEAEKFILSEYKTLAKLNKIDFHSIILPQEPKLFKPGNSNSLFQDDVFSESNSFPNELNPLILNASIELAKKTENQIFKNTFFSETREFAQKIPNDIIKSTLLKQIDSLEKNNVYPVLLHGDFVLYNMKKKHNQLALIDWEFSRYGLPLFDLFHFIFHGKFQIEKKSIKKCIREVSRKKNLQFYKSYLEELHLEFKMWESLFRLYLLDALKYDYSLKPWMKPEDSHFYRALQILVT